MAQPAKAAPQPRAGTLARAARDYAWLLEHRDLGRTARRIARDWGTTREAVKAGLKRARELDAPRPAPDEFAPGPFLKARPVFPLGAFTPSSACPHPPGAVKRPPASDDAAHVCMVCHEFV